MVEATTANNIAVANLVLLVVLLVISVAFFSVAYPTYIEERRIEREMERERRANGGERQMNRQRALRAYLLRRPNMDEPSRRHLREENQE